MKQHRLTMTWRQIEVSRWIVSEAIETGRGEAPRPYPTRAELEGLEKFFGIVSTGIEEGRR